MVGQPAGWSYWIHDCDRVQIDGLKILANVRYPNNDGIHVNFSRDVTISDCIIETGDDSLVVRANSRSLKENKTCERVIISNCSLRSWSAGIRIGWTNDGVIRDCSFSNIVMHDTSVGIALVLPRRKDAPGWTDYGREATEIESLSFNNIRTRRPTRLSACRLEVFGLFFPQSCGRHSARQEAPRRGLVGPQRRTRLCLAPYERLYVRQYGD